MSYPVPDQATRGLKEVWGRYFSSLARYLRYPAVLASTLTALLLLAATGIFLEQHRESRLKENLQSNTQSISAKIDDRLLASSLILRSTSGLFSGSGLPDRKTWHHYLQNLQLHKTQPGLQGLGFAIYLKPHELKPHLATVQRDGFAHYAIRPEGTREAYSSILYVEPFEGRNAQAMGYDMYSDPRRREAMARARDSGEVAFTERLTLILEPSGNAQAGILAYFPIYKNGIDPGNTQARRENLLGWAYAPFRMGDFFSALLQSHAEDMRLEVFDSEEADQDKLLFDSHPNQPRIKNIPETLCVHTMGGRAWTVRFTPLAEFPGYSQGLEKWLSRGGLLLIALLLLGISFEFLKARQLAETLKESDLRFRSLADSGSTLVWAADEQGHFYYFNRPWLEFTGRSLDQESGQGWLEGIHPDDRASCRQPYEDAFTRHERFTLTYRLRRSDGIYRWFVDEATPRFDSQGVFQGYIGHCLDITENKRVNDQLRASESRYAMLAEVSLVGIYHADADGNCLYVNERWCSLAGIAADAALGDGWLEAIHPEDRFMVNREWTRAISENRHAELEYRLQKPDGSVIWVYGQVASTQDETENGAGYVGTITDITPLKEAEAKILSLAFYDTLTDLPNRRLLMDRLGQAVAVSRRNGQYGALLFIDLDNFKTLNDTQGHDVGDKLLIEVGTRLREAVRAGDTVARLGGDEFVVMLEDLGEAAKEAANLAENVAEKVQVALKRPYALRPSGVADYYNTPSIGVSLFQGEETSMDNLLKQADMALYQAKGSGRNTIRFFNPDMQAALEARTALEIGLRQALQDNEFFLHYQPQIDRSRRIVGAEALLRWQPAQGDMIPVAGFIPVAEETGLILPLGQWVLETACAQLKAWENIPHLNRLEISVNISPRQFRQHDFVAQVLDTLKRFGANPSLLKIELTESVVLDDVDDTIQKMRELRRMGISFSLDDFGTGYSSLSYLKRLPLDQLKIDRSFVQDIETDDNDAAICAAIIALALNLGLQVVAEGVETNAQHYFLAVEHHCNLMQGYLFGKPMSAPDLEALVLGQFQPRSRI